MAGSNTKRIASNTLALYFRMAVMMLIGLYTSRVVLKVLGVEDYGTYNVVGGVVSMFSLLTSSMSSSISRFLTFELGRGDVEHLKKVFSTSLNVQFIMAGIIIVATEIVGVWFLNYKMNIPEGRMDAANWVMQCSILTFVAGLLMSPYNASIISHEKMGIYAYVSVWDAVMKLVIVFALYISPFDKLKSYAVLLLCVSLMTTCIYWIYCKKHFEECKYQRILDKKLLKEITGYAGWGVVGDGAFILNTQGVNILINLFFGVTLNAARGIATIVDNMLQNFVRNFMVALNPQIIKSYSVGNLALMHKLVVLGAKYSFFLTIVFLIPICLETKLLLTLWLSVVPDYAVVFTQLSLIASACIALTKTLTTAVSATGKIRDFELVVCLMYLLIFPITWLAFGLGFSSVSSYIVYLVVVFLMVFAKIHIVAPKIKMRRSYFIKNVLFKAFLVSVLSIIFPLLICIVQSDSFMRFIEVCIITLISSFVSIWTVGINKREKEYLLAVLREHIGRKRR